MKSRLLLLVFLCILPVQTQQTLAQSISKSMVEVPYKGKNYVGQPLVWDGRDLMLLRRDGRMSRLPVTNIHALEIVNDKYKPYRKGELIGMLRAEFGAKYQVSATKDFVVVHPIGSAQTWAQPFQDLYYRFQVFFKARGIKLSTPQYPLVAVVLRTRKEYDRFITDYQPGMKYSGGYYNPRSNRIITYDHSDHGDWLDSNDTIVHEATHQTAYNIGIHRRFGYPPRWATEGLAQLFEAKGINNSRNYSRMSDRINKQCLKDLKRYYRKGQVNGAVEKLVQSDSMFRTDVDRAYAVSWGLAFFLSEKYPRKYAEYLAHDGARKPFKTPSRTARAKDFAKFFGSNLQNLEARMKTFYTSL